MRAVILQPSYIPWRGYFDLIHRADVFVFYDDVQYTTNDWRNRNRIRVPGGSSWLTIPVLSKGHLSANLLVNEARIAWERPWNRTHRDKLVASYRGTPGFARTFPAVEAMLEPAHPLLVDYTIPLTEHLARELGIARTRFVRSSELGIAHDNPTQRLVDICAHLGADRYLSGPRAQAYLETERFAQAGIALEYINYAYPEYEQIAGPYDPAVSVLDLLFMHGERAPELIWGASGE